MMKTATIMSAMALIAALNGSRVASAETTSDRIHEKMDTKQYSACLAKADSVTMNIVSCSEDEISAQNAIINQAYKQVLLQLSPDQTSQLRADERAWIKRRDTNCKKDAADFVGGTDYPIEYDGCIIEQTELRTIYLRKMISR